MVSSSYCVCFVIEKKQEARLFIPNLPFNNQQQKMRARRRKIMKCEMSVMSLFGLLYVSPPYVAAMGLGSLVAWLYI